MTTHRVPEGVGWVDLPEGALVAVFGRADRVQLSGTAFDIWAAAAAGRTTDEIAAHLEDVYVDAPHALSDVVGATVADLVTAGLLEPAQPRPSSEP